MYFKFDSIMNDEDYINFNVFYQTMTPEGQLGIKMSRIRLITVSLMLCIIVLVLSKSVAHTVFVFAALLIYLVVFCLRKKQNAVRNTKRAMKFNENVGKKLYSQYAVMEFMDESFVETADGIRTEVLYSVVKGVKILNGRYIYIDINRNGYYILPFKSFCSNEECTAFIDFLRSKISNVTFY